tara:strand:- start:587 stop:949 length:363 start_codon:yes stop_codon:yes gene_type:complete
MAFKMNKNNVNFGEGTGSSPKKFGGFFSSDNVATPNDGSNMGNMIGNLLSDAQKANREQLKGRKQRIDIPVDGGSDTVGDGNKQYASGFGPEGADNNQIQSLLQNIQNLLQGGGVIGGNN